MRDHIIVTVIITPISQCDDHFDTLWDGRCDDHVWTHGQCDHMVSVPIVKVMITSNSGQYDYRQSSHVTVYAASVWQCDGVLQRQCGILTVYAATV